MRVLIPGASGAIARKVALAPDGEGHEVIGIDRRPWPDAPIEFHEVDIRKRAAEDVFRKRAPRGRRPHGDGDVARRAGRGALPDQPRRHARRLRPRARLRRQALHLRRPPHLLRRRPRLAALPHRGRAADRAQRFPELADLVAADLYAATALWRFPELATTVLRICYTLGPTGHGTLASFLRGSACRWCSASIRSFSSCTRTTSSRRIVLALEKRPRGVFNVAGPQPLPLSRVVGGAGRTAVPLPEFVLEGAPRPLRLPEAAARRAHAHQVPGRRRRARLPRGDGLRARARRDRRRVARLPRRVPRLDRCRRERPHQSPISFAT